MHWQLTTGGMTPIAASGLVIWLLRALGSKQHVSFVMCLCKLIPGPHISQPLGRHTLITPA